MTARVERHNDNDIVERVLPRQKLSLDQLEAALKQRIGWVDEVITPFVRRNEQSGQMPEAKSTAG